MNRRIYIYHPALPEEIGQIFEALNDKIHIERQTDSMIVLFDEDYYNEEPIDLEEFYLLLIEDFEQQFTMFLEPYMDKEFDLANEIEAFLPSLPPSLYYFEDIITYAVLLQNSNLKQQIKTYLLTVTNAEVIHTVREFIENNMNSSLSAKKLYMHRNTLNYRIDNFIDASHINVKTFKGANAIYMLYKY
jgi:hypothetical protein